MNEAAVLTRLLFYTPPSYHLHRFILSVYKRPVWRS